MHRIQLLKPRGFLSFSDDFPGVELGPLNVFVGPNGSGKSNLIEAARFLSLAPTGLRPALTRGGASVSDWCFGDTQTASVDVVVRGPPRRTALHYRLEIWNESEVRICSETLEEHEPGKRGRSYLRNDRGEIRLTRKNGRERKLAGKIDPSHPIIDQIKDATEYPEMDWMRRHLAAYRFITEAHFGGRNNPLREAQSAAQPQEFLLEDGKNLPLIINTLHQRSGMRAAMLEHVREVYPYVDQIEVDFSMGETQILFIETKSGARTPAVRLSDGTIRWLFLGALLLDERDNAPVFIDEPDLALHPDALIPLGRLIRRASQTRQVFITTHSDGLLSEFTQTPDVVQVFDRVNGSTRVTRLDAKELKSWLQTNSLGEIWKSGRIGGNRW
jgi:predicted ATPase